MECCGDVSCSQATILSAASCQDPGEEMVISYIAQYPVPVTAENVLALLLPCRPVQSNTVSISLGSIQCN